MAVKCSVSSGWPVPLGLGGPRSGKPTAPTTAAAAVC